MSFVTIKKLGAAAFGATLALGVGSALAAETPKRGGILNFVVGSKIPSFDGHKEGTFGMIHPIRPFYSTLIRVNPDNPQSTTDFVCDVCSEFAVSDDGLTYTFKIRNDIKFHDGTPLTGADVKATYDKIVFPPEGILSLRKKFLRWCWRRTRLRRPYLLHRSLSQRQTNCSVFLATTVPNLVFM